MTPPRRALVAIDLGRRRVGVAVSHPAGELSLPHAILEPKTRRALIDQLKELAEERDADFVLGLPVELDGAERRPAKDARAFGRTLAKATGRTVHLQDETLTTVSATELAAEASRPPGAAVDDLAAQQILELYLRQRG